MGAWSLVLVLAAGGLAVAFDAGIDAVAGIDLRDIALVILGLMIAALVALVNRAVAAGQTRHAIRAMSGAMLIGGTFIAGYSLKDEIATVVHRATGDTAQPLTLRSDVDPASDRAVRIRRRSDGHFIARAEINGQGMPMLVDTGASMVVLKPADAQKLGIETERLRYTVPVQTANGTTYAATVRLRNVGVGPIHFDDIEALVARPGTLKDSLLGMTFLNKLRSYEFSGDYLTFRL